MTDPHTLTFGELRLATLLRSEPANTDMSAMARLLADRVIHADRIAASMNIDLAAAIRSRFEPAP